MSKKKSVKSKKQKTALCPLCNSKAKEVVFTVRSEKVDSHSGKPLQLRAKKMVCSNEVCKADWQTADEIQRINGLLMRSAWQTLKPDQWKQIRECLGFGTKTLASRFLGLNDKAFSKYENGYNEQNLSVDLLVRLVVHSKENFEFVQNLHAKDFKFQTSDYELLCEQKGENWTFTKARPDQDPLASYQIVAIDKTTAIDLSEGRPEANEVPESFLVNEESPLYGYQH